MSPTPSRRNLLKAVAALPALLGGAQAATIPARRLRVAALVPQHEALPGFTAAFLAGLETALLPGAALLVTRSGPRPTELRQAAGVALRAGPDVLVTLGDGVAELVATELPAGLPVIAAGPGAAPTRRPTRAGLLGASLHAWEGEWLMGQHLAPRRTPTFLLISALDSGYDLPFAFASGLEAGGGQLLGSAVLDPQLAGGALRAAVAAAQAAGARHLHLQDSAQVQTADVLRAARQLGLSVSVGSLGTGAAQVRSAAPSATPLPAALRRAAGALASHPAAALGHDVGTWLSRGAAQLPHLTPLGLTAALSTGPVRGLRGELLVTPDGLLRAPLVLETPGHAPQPLRRLPHTALNAQGLRSGHLYAFPHAGAPG
ncbi:hypothetical protein [Deinococcus arcticus]|uniref:Leucine-binding protein domain-containing protein n=1 Tax=Deinococcus arcticus TaxID=2136176 RepID=A0A2T3W9M9_9DEIO|nr:hypothetical protein [Deinococcus arcticus]PTA68504.1 hypothetical protein C8263_06805 [Deinococcus arcticus]